MRCSRRTSSFSRRTSNCRRRSRGCSAKPGLSKPAICCSRPGGYQLSPGGKTELINNIVPKLTGLQNAKIVVYGYTDNEPVGPQLQRAGINDNLTLSSRRAGEVVTYLISQGVNANIISAKGFGDTHPVAPNDTPEGRAKNRRIVITVQGPGAPSA